MAKQMSKLPYSSSLEEEMKRNPDLKMSDIEMLKEWCEKQAHFPKVPMIILALFLHSNYYNIEAAKVTAENFLTMRTHLPEFFSNKDPLGDKNLRKAFSVITVLKLQGESKEGYDVFYGNYLNPEPSQFVFSESIKYMMMVADMEVFKNGLRKGQIFVGDAAHLSFSHVARINPTALKKYVCYIQDAAPIRLKGIHIINAPQAAELLLNLAKPFMKAELLKIVHFHPSLEALSKYMSPDLLPNESGGKAGPLKELHAQQIKKLEDNREYFLEDEALLRVNESLRIGKNKINELFGVEGSFKKLEID